MGLTLGRRSGEYACAGCGEIVDGSEAASIWIDHPLGLTALRTHRTQECAKAALAASECKMMPGNRPPMSATEKLKEAKENGERERRETC